MEGRLMWNLLSGSDKIPRIFRMIQGGDGSNLRTPPMEFYEKI